MYKYRIWICPLSKIFIYKGKKTEQNINLELQKIWDGDVVFCQEKSLNVEFLNCLLKTSAYLYLDWQPMLMILFWESEDSRETD